MSEPDSASVVLDTSAILAYLHGETGGELVKALIARGAAISAVNWAEVLSKGAERSENPEEAIRLLEEMGFPPKTLRIVPLQEQDCADIARLRASTRFLGLSLGDRACLALGQSLKLPVYTADRRWLEVKAPHLKVEAIR